MFSVLGASLLISSSNLISMYLSIELQSFAVYILSTLYRNSESATTAGLKYFLLGSLASCFILLGSGLIYTFTGLTNLESIYNLISVTGPISNITLGIALGFIFIFAGFLLKVAAAPLHNWAPDVYDESPTIVTIWLTIMPKISILIFILEIFTQITSVSPILESLETVSGELGLNSINNLLLISSLFSLIIGTVVGLAQTKIKRLLAYSTISHIGFILLALAINSKQSIDSFIFYIIQYTLTNLNTFLILLAVGYIINYKTILNKGSEKDIKYISELKGLFFSNPILSISLTICLLSMAGTPPLLGFFSKQFVLYSAIESGYYFMAISGILVSIISASYYLRIIRILHTEIEFNKSLNDEINTTVPAPEGVGISNIHSLLISSLTLLILFFVLKPSILLKSTQLLSLSLYSS
jgi:NADH-ubiquinone oxidoreductase chain 2